MPTATDIRSLSREKTPLSSIEQTKKTIKSDDEELGNRINNLLQKQEEYKESAQQRSKALAQFKKAIKTGKLSKQSYKTITEYFGRESLEGIVVENEERNDDGVTEKGKEPLEKRDERETSSEDGELPDTLNIVSEDVHTHKKDKKKKRKKKKKKTKTKTGKNESEGEKKECTGEKKIENGKIPNIDPIEQQRVENGEDITTKDNKVIVSKVQKVEDIVKNRPGDNSLVTAFLSAIDPTFTEDDYKGLPPSEKNKLLEERAMALRPKKLETNEILDKTDEENVQKGSPSFVSCLKDAIDPTYTCVGSTVDPTYACVDSTVRAVFDETDSKKQDGKIITMDAEKSRKRNQSFGSYLMGVFDPTYVCLDTICVETDGGTDDVDGIDDGTDDGINDVDGTYSGIDGGTDDEATK